MKMAVKDLIDHSGDGQHAELDVAWVEHAAAAKTAARNTQFTFGLVHGECANAHEAKRTAFDAM